MDRMMLKGVILHLAVSLVAGNISNPDRHCDIQKSVPIGQQVALYSPNWPKHYKPGVVCRWIFDCPDGYSCQVECHDGGLPKAPKCDIDQLLVSTIGNAELQDADVYCGQMVINSKSYGSRLTIGLKTSRSSPGGSFRCKIKTEPEV